MIEGHEAPQTRGPELTHFAYCTECGALLDANGRCATHGPPQPQTHEKTQPEQLATPTHRTSLRKRLWVSAVVFLAILVIAESVFAWRYAFETRSSLNRVKRDVAALKTDVGGLHRDNDVASASSRYLSLRIGRLEAAAKRAIDPATLARNAQPSVFTVETSAGQGSAWVAASHAGTSELVTNFHVIADTYTNGGRSVRLRTGDRSYDATITATNAADDLAVITVAAALPVLAIRTSEPAPGDAVLVVGSPLGLGGTVSTGIVSAVRTEQGVRYVQFTAPISPGNSGSPVLDGTGKVIGVAEAKVVADGAEGLAFAVPANDICTDFDVC